MEAKMILQARAAKILSVLVLAVAVFSADLVFAEDAKGSLVLGIRTKKGQSLSAPDPGKSNYLKTYEGGFVVSEYGARYYCLWDITRERDRRVYVRMEFENPADKGRPLVEESVIDPGKKSLYVATDYVQGLALDHQYLIKVFLYKDAEKKVLIDQLDQPVRSYVDMRNKKVTVKPGAERTEMKK
jgi:hypothetical protein